MINLTPIFQAIIALIAALITYKLIPWIKARTTSQQQANLAAAAKIAVYAAEQLFGSGAGQKKLDYAKNVLLAAGYDIDTEILRAAIENAVYNMPGWIDALPAETAPTPEHPPEEAAKEEPEAPVPEKEVPAEYISPANDET